MVVADGMVVRDALHIRMQILLILAVLEVPDILVMCKMEVWQMDSVLVMALHVLPQCIPIILLVQNIIKEMILSILNTPIVTSTVQTIL